MPGSSVGQSSRRRWWPSAPELLAQTEAILQLCPEILIEPAVNERVVARAAGGQPVKSKIECVVAADDLAGEEDDVAVQGEPADRKNDHHQHQHLNGRLLLPLKAEELLDGHVPHGVAEPESFGNAHIGDQDNDEGQNIEQDERGQVQVLPEEVGRFREIGEAQGSGDFFAAVRDKTKHGEFGDLVTIIIGPQCWGLHADITIPFQWQNL